MKLPFRILTPANRDVHGILLDLTERAGPRVALAFEQELRDALDALSRNSGIGHRRDDLTDKSVLFFSVSPYLLIYEITGSSIVIHAVLHGARDISGILKRRRF